MRINNNLMAMNTHRQLGLADTGAAKSMEKLSSGFRINRAGDDAAGLAISEKMRGQIRGLNQASRNAQDGISLIQTAEGALNETHAILQRMRELAVQSATDTNTESDRAEIQKEVDELAQEITRIATTTQFNTMNLLDGTYEDKLFHIGANAGQNATIAIENMDAGALEVASEEVSEVKATATAGGIEFTAEGEGAAGNGMTINLVAGAATDNSVTVGVTGNVITFTYGTTATAADVVSAIAGSDAESLVTATATGTIAEGTAITAGGVSARAAGEGGIDVSTQTAADSAITVVDSALGKVSSERSKLGAMQNRLEHTIKNLDTSAENLQASEARIRDVDMAKEMMEMTKQNILQQASTAMLAQANQAPQTVLQLLR